MLNYGLIGCGSVGKVHCHHFSEDERISRVVVCDTSQLALNYFRENFKIDEVYSDYKKMLEEEDLDIVSVATPPGYHLEHANAAAFSGSHVLCEKPLAATLDDSIEIVEYFKKQGLKLGVMMPRRFYNNSQVLKDALDNGALGDITQVQLNFKANKDKFYYRGWRARKSEAGGGILPSQMIHSLDRLIFLFGKPVKVEGMVRTTRNYLEIEDEVDAKIWFDNGVEAEITGTNNSDQNWRDPLYIGGEKGMAVIESCETFGWRVPGFDRPEVDERDDIPRRFKNEYYGPGHEGVIEDFISSVIEDREPKITAEQSLDVLKVIFGIYRASEEGKAVNLV